MTTDKELAVECLVSSKQIGEWMQRNRKTGFVVDYTREAQLEYAIPIIKKAVAEEIMMGLRTLLSFTVKVEEKAVSVDKHDWDRVIEYVYGKPSGKGE